MISDHSSWIDLISYGGADTITGSSHLVRAMVGGGKHYLTDAGTFSGKNSRMLNENISHIINKVDAIFLTHAHIDHIGRLAYFYKLGYRGPIYATEPVKELTETRLGNSAELQQTAYRLSLKYGDLDKTTYYERTEFEPLYSIEDATEVMKQFITVKRGKKIKIDEFLEVSFYNAGHEAGSSSIMFDLNNGNESYRIYFSGDIGQSNPLLKKRVDSFKKDVDFVIMESTYADRIKQDKDDPWKKIRETIANTILKGGDAVFPLTAGRIPGIIYLYYKDIMENNDWISEVLRTTPIIVDSSMGAKIIEQFKKFVSEFSADARRFMENKENNIFNFPNLIIAGSTEESKNTILRKEPYVVLSTNSICNAGRILHHLKKDLSNPNSSIIFTIYQSEGSLGNRIVKGYKRVKIFGEEIDIAAKVTYIDAFFEHADQVELIKWLGKIEKGYKLFLSHGEPVHQKNLKNKLTQLRMLEEKDIELMTYGKIYHLYKGRIEMSTFGIETKRSRKAKASINKRNIQAIQQSHYGVQCDFYELYEPAILRVLNSLRRDVKRERMIYRNKKERLERICK